MDDGNAQNPPDSPVMFQQCLMDLSEDQPTNNMTCKINNLILSVNNITRPQF